MNKLNTLYDELETTDMPDYIAPKYLKLYERSREVIKSNLHLCRTCIHNIATCNSTTIEFGDSLSRDNVYKCKTYEELSDEEK